MEAAEANGTFGALVRLLLLTAQRREKVVTMRPSDLSPDGVWQIPSEDREKSNAGELKLPEQALAIIKAQPKLASNDYVFAGRGGGPINGFSKLKHAFDQAAGVCGWTLHDLRRTARSLMSRAGVLSEHSERVLGHAVKGVEGTYDVYDYGPEKAAAVAKLAQLVEQIVCGEPDDPAQNVVPIVRA